MMTNLFSIFDPATSSSMSLNWLSCMIPLIIFPFQFWMIPSRYIMFWHKLFYFIFSEFKPLIQYSHSNLILFISLFSIILINNFFGLFPYIFTASSHMSFCLTLSLTFWLSTILYSIINYFNILMAHLTPQGTPVILMPFMVLIESISLIIRPITLAIRLTANMIAGHLLLCLLGNTGFLITNPLLLIIMIMTQFFLYILEISVSLIQAYVFSVLSTLYSSEV